MQNTNTLKINTLLLDLDGTLLDTAPDLANTLNSLLNQYGHPSLPYDSIRPYASTGTRGLLNLGFQIAETDPNFGKLRQEFLSYYDAHLTDSSQLFNGMSQALDAIEKRDLRWGVVTNKPTSFAQKLLRYFNLNQRCACLVGGDMVKNLKPAPDSLLVACMILQVTPQQCIYVGDTERDIIAAKQAGMYAVAATYGYTFENENALNWNADDYIHQPEDILSLKVINNSETSA